MTIQKIESEALNLDMHSNASKGGLMIIMQARFMEFRATTFLKEQSLNVMNYKYYDALPGNIAFTIGWYN